MTWDNVASFFDAYSRVARVYPALLTMAPLLWSTAVLWPETITFDWSKAALLILGAACLLYLLSTIARARGKAIEPGVIERCGGWPTTVLLRYRDRTIDVHTKDRYRAALGEMCSDLTFPTREDELAKSDDADLVYRSATKRLMEARRGPEHKILHAENAQYGYWRNMLGMRWIGVFIAVTSALVALGVWLVEFHVGRSLSPIIDVLVNHWQLPLLAFVNLAYGLIVWGMVVREKAVCQAGREYAEALLKTLDGPAPAAAKAP